MRFQLATLHGNFETPPYEDAVVSDAMRPGLYACDADDSLADVARVMATRHVHCVALLTGDNHNVHGVISSQDLLRAAAAGPDRSAVAAASSAFIRAEPEHRLADRRAHGRRRRGSRDRRACRLTGGRSLERRRRTRHRLGTRVAPGEQPLARTR